MRKEKVMKKLPLTCPCKKKCPLVKVGEAYLCSEDGCVHSEAEMQFPIKNETPVLISEKNTDTVCSMNVNATYIKRPLVKFKKIKKILIGESQITKRNCNRFIEELFNVAKRPKILIIGSGEKGSGTEKLWSRADIDIHGIDIYGAATVDVICDAHYLPLLANSYDGVWIQAVLEHVVEPKKVVNEIYRVLKERGVVYAETPFMQQVHEGAYDFTRFTVLGHRYLFKNFEMMDIGGNGGPEVVFVWAIRYLSWAIFRSQKIARLIGVLAGILMRPLFFLVSEKSMHDASSGVYFLGRKNGNNTVTHKELVQLYKGQFR